MSPQGMRSETGNVYASMHQLFAERLAEVAAIFIAHPRVQASSIVITPQGRIEVTAEGVAGVLRDWSHAVPQHRTATALVPTAYGAAEADVVEGDHIRVIVRRPLHLNGGA